MSKALKGLDELRAALRNLADKTSLRAGKAGVNAGLGVLKREIVSRVNSLPISPELKAAARATVAKRLMRKEGHELVGKVGFAVGSRSQKKKETAHQRAARGQGGANEVRGVGLSAANIHWATLGTAARQTGGESVRTSDSGRQRLGNGGEVHNTGRMPAALAGVIQEACDSASDETLQAAGDKVRQVLEREGKK